MIVNMNSIQPKTKELAIHHCGCHGNLVIIAMRYMADAYCPKDLHSKYGFNMTEDKGVSDILLWLPW